ncbi:hypothetical protein BH23ACT10_BH23ACT10_34700 [soil metagenome]
MTESTSVQRSFRISARTLELLDSAAVEGAESRNALVDRLLGEAIRVERHPLVRFQQGAGGRRRPQLTGTRLYVHHVMPTLRDHEGDIAETAAYFDVDTQLIRSALAYYADHADEVDADIADDLRVADDERSRWARQRRVIG